MEAYRDPIPFAYNASLDTISYMSCSGVRRGREQGIYYTFKFGAYREGSGLGMTQRFRSYQEGLTADELIENLNKGEHMNSDLGLQVSVRSVSDLYEGALAVGGEVHAGWEYSDLFYPLDDPELIRALLKLGLGEKLRMFNFSSSYDQNRFLEGNLNFLSSEDLAQKVRAKLISGETLLALTFSKESLGTKTNAFPYIKDYEKYDEFKKLRQEGEDIGVETTERDWMDFFEVDRKKVYGIGYRMNYRAGLGLKEGERFPIYHQTDGLRAVSSVTEIDLITKKETGRKWKCVSYIIIRLTDNHPQEGSSGGAYGSGEVLCPKQVEDPHNPDPAYQALRGMLSMDAWSINNKKRCVVSKKAYDTCYLDTRTHRSEVIENALPHRINYFGGSCGGRQVDCPHYVSICYVVEE